MELSVTVMTAHPVHHQVASASAGWQWLHRAAEMAAAATGSVNVYPVGDGPVTGTVQAADSTVPGAAPLPDSPDWPCYPRIAMRTPGTAPSCISAARRFTSRTLERWGVADREPDVAVVVSELLSNALRHGLRAPVCSMGRPIRLGLVYAGPAVVCAVADPSDEMPVPREPCWLDESGRGLHVIASLSDKWGSCSAPGRPGKVVWATFATA
jgi:hypothetical protein